KDFLYVADCKLATSKNLQYIVNRGGRFISLLPRTRKEDTELRKRLVDAPDKVAWKHVTEGKRRVAGVLLLFRAAGAHAEAHTGFDELMRRVKKDRSFQYVLCSDVARCDGIDLPEWYSDECLKAGKAVIYAKSSDCENPDPLLPILLHSERLRYNDCCSPGRRIRRGRMFAAQKGYWVGGSPPYGMQRLLLDGNGSPLRLLEPGERKIVRSHRVALVAGESAEVATIRRIFHQFVNLGHSTARIAKGLNAKRIPSPVGGTWKSRQVLACLRNEAYAKPIAYHRKKSRRTSPRGEEDQWVHTPKAGACIVGLQQFRRTQEMLA
ncbi:recombinase family protein, partial [Crocinitomicaceae bacterium]|nr:recombinase family protein [Crocinitomicaceae bacterium]